MVHNNDNGAYFVQHHNKLREARTVPVLLDKARTVPVLLDKARTVPVLLDKARTVPVLLDKARSVPMCYSSSLISHWLRVSKHKCYPYFL